MMARPELAAAGTHCALRLVLGQHLRAVFGLPSRLGLGRCNERTSSLLELLV